VIPKEFSLSQGQAMADARARWQRTPGLRQGNSGQIIAALAMATVIGSVIGAAIVLVTLQSLRLYVDYRESGHRHARKAV
jgi:hypothetical protein